MEGRELLSEREKEVLRLVAKGLTNRQIARELFISVNTVKVHLRNIFSKLDVESRTEAVLYAIREGWVVVEGAPPEEVVAVEPIERISTAKRAFFLLTAAVISAALLLAHPTGEKPFSEPPSALTDSEAEKPPLGLQPEVSRWKSRAQMPTPRCRFALVSYENKLYAIGGETPDGVSGAVEVYAPAQDDWMALKEKPTPVSNISAAVVEGLIYIPGGRTADGNVTDVLEVYDPLNGTWEERSPLPVPLCAYAIASVGGKLYIFGGWDGTRYVASVYEYDPAEDVWEVKTPMPTARGFSGAGVIEGKVYVVGGYDGVRELAVCEVYDPAEEEWEKRSPMGVGRGGLGVAVVGGSLYAIGGGWKSYLAFNERYDPKTDTWSSFETPILAQWRNLGVAATETTIYAIGGWNGGYMSANREYQALYFIFLPVTP